MEPKTCSICLEENPASEVLCPVCKHDILCASCYEQYPGSCPTCRGDREREEGKSLKIIIPETKKLTELFLERGLLLDCAFGFSSHNEQFKATAEYSRRACDALDRFQETPEELIKELTGKMGLRLLYQLRSDSVIKIDKGFIDPKVNHVIFIMTDRVTLKSIAVVWIEDV